MGIWKHEKDSVDATLRANRPDPSDDLVTELGRQVLASTPTSARRGSRVAFGSALTVLMLGTFASFGGAGYAAESAQSTAKAVKRIVAPAKQERLPVRSRATAASAQYHEQAVPSATSTKPKPKPAATVQVAGATAGKPGQSGTLPFTGYGLGATAALGSLLLAAGVFLRRRESRSRA